MAPVTGSFAELAALKRTIAAFVDGSAQRQIVEAVAQAAVTEVDRGFALGVDPYDQPWAPLTYRTGKTLDDEGNLRRALTRFPIITQQGFVITTRGATSTDSVRYAGTHQYGKIIRAKTPRGMRFRVGGTSRTNGEQWVTRQEVTIPQRQMVPENTLGPRWTGAFERAAESAVQQIAGRAT